LPGQLSSEFADNLYDQVFTIWANPELERRRLAGAIPNNFVLWAVQVIFEPSGPQGIRFNEEVNGEFRSREGMAEGVVLTPLNFHEAIPYLEAFHLSLDDSPNAGHITLIRHQQGFYIAFDLLYNAARIAEHVMAAREFLDATRDAATARRYRVFVADLHHATELMAKALLLRHPDAAVLNARSHRLINSRYNRHAHQGNVDKNFARLLNELSQARNPARYPVGEFTLDEARSGTWLNHAEAMYTSLVEAAPIRTRMALSREGA
jgi:uncharacterized protein (UPF0332 family)